MDKQYSKSKLTLVAILLFVAIAFANVSCSKQYVDQTTGNVYKIEEVCVKGYYVDEPQYMPIAQPDGSVQFQYYINHVYKCVKTTSDTILIGNQKDLK